MERFARPRAGAAEDLPFLFGADGMFAPFTIVSEQNIFGLMKGVR
jgi:hypothetical protein